MSSRSTLYALAGAAAIAAIAWIAWPHADVARSAPDAGAAPRLAPPITVRKPDTSSSAGGIRFALRDRRGASAAGVELTAAATSGGEPPARATSAADGIAVVPIAPPGRWRLAVAGARIAGASELELDGAPDGDLTIALDRDAPPATAPIEDLPPGDRSGGVTGVITGAGARVPDITIALVYDGALGPGHRVVNAATPHPIAIPPRRFAGGAGAFRWPELPPGGYDVWIASAGWGTAHTHATVEAHGWGDASMTLAPAASLSGTVDDGRGVAIEGVRVSAEVDGRELAASTTLGDGVYLLDDLPAGAITIRASIAKDVCTPFSSTVTATAGKRTTSRLAMTCAWQGH